MTTRTCLARWLLAVSLTTAALSLLTADEPARPAEPGTLLVTDSAGKDQTLKAWKFGLGTRHLTWLASADAGKEPEIKEPEMLPPGTKAPPRKIAPRSSVGPEALVFREERSTTFKDGVDTLIPLARLRGLEFVEGKDPTVTARVAGGKEESLDLVLKGSTKYVGINKLVIKEKIDRGAEGIAEMTYSAGVPKGGIRAVRFPAPKVEAAATPAGRQALVVIADKEKSKLAVSDLRALYQLPDGSERLASVLMFKQSLKRDLARLARVEAIQSETQDTVWQMTLKDGGEDSLSLHRTVTLDGKHAHLEGLVGKVPAGFKLFPIHTIASIEFDKTVEK
jgi:hypothetical protein